MLKWVLRGLLWGCWKRVGVGVKLEGVGGGIVLRWVLCWGGCFVGEDAVLGWGLC